MKLTKGTCSKPCQIRNEHSQGGAEKYRDPTHPTHKGQQRKEKVKGTEAGKVGGEVGGWEEAFPSFRENTHRAEGEKKSPHCPCPTPKQIPKVKKGRGGQEENGINFISG